MRMEPSPAHSPRVAAFTLQQQQLQRQASESDQALIQQEGGAGGGGDDGDECMSNDESMSSSSSLGIEDVETAIGDFQSSGGDCAFAHHHQQQQQQDGQQGSAPPAHSHAYPFGMNFSNLSTPFASPAAAADSTGGMWLLTQFAPAMSKAVRSANKSERMDDGESGSNDDADETRRAKWRVKWADDDAPPLEFVGGVQLVAARNEVTGIQVRLASNRAFQVATDCTNWFTAQGHAPRARVHADVSFIPPHLQVEALVVGYVEDENGELTMEYFDKANVSTATGSAREHAVYIRLRVAQNVRPGAYEIPIRVFTQRPGFTDEQLSWSSCVHVRVADVALPSPSEWTFHLDLWQHLSSIARAHGAALWSDRHFALIENYLATLSEFGQKSITIVATEMPWAGQQCYLEKNYPSALFEHAILQVYELSSHRSDDHPQPALEIDFQHFDRLLRLARKYKMDAEIEIFGLLSIWRDAPNGFGGPVDDDGDTTRLHLHHHPHQQQRRRRSSSSSSADRQDGDAGRKEQRSSSASPPSPSDKTSPRLDSWRIRCFSKQTGAMRYLRRVAEIERFITLLYEHCVALEIVERVRVCADEPSELALFFDQMSFLQRLAPGFRIKLAMNNLEFLSFAPPQIVDYVPLLPLVCADLEATKRVKAQIHERGGKFCWYVCCGPRFPNQFVSSPLVEGELVGYLTFFLELDGFLRWNFCLWPDKPWTSLRWRAADWKVGDMYFVLPGSDGCPVETLRLESLRFAIQVYELLRMAQDALSHAQLEQLKSEVAQLIWRTSDFAQFCKLGEVGGNDGGDGGGGISSSDLYSLDPLDYQRAKVLIIDTLTTAKLTASALTASSSHGLSSASFGEEHLGTPPASPRAPLGY